MTHLIEVEAKTILDRFDTEFGPGVTAIVEVDVPDYAYQNQIHEDWGSEKVMQVSMVCGQFSNITALDPSKPVDIDQLLEGYTMWLTALAVTGLEAAAMLADRQNSSDELQN